MKTGTQQTNILIIWGDDVGMWNISAYHRGMMGGRTPAIDRIASEGMLFMEHYAQACSTAGRAAFITGQYPIRLGLTRDCVPGSSVGISKEDPTLAELLKQLGYATAHFGKNHLGDRDEHLPTVHGFDEFFGILYGLHAGEYTEQRGVLHSWAACDGEQELVEKGAFDLERQRTLDTEILEETKHFISGAVKSDRPFFVWHNATRMHSRTSPSAHYAGRSGYGPYADSMMELDDTVGALLQQLDDLGVADNTLVMFATANGAASSSWPDGGNQPFRGEKGVGGYEGAFRVPVVVRWPGRIPAGTTSGEFMSMEDWLPTIMSMLGHPNLKDHLLQGCKVGRKTYKVHIDGVDQTAMVTGTGKTRRKEFYYFTETALHGLRYGDWKFLFTYQDKRFNGAQSTLTTPVITNLKLDPFERFQGARGFDDWQENRSWVLVRASVQVGAFLKSLRAFPPRQKRLDFDIHFMMKLLNENAGC